MTIIICFCTITKRIWSTWWWWRRWQSCHSQNEMEMHWNLLWFFFICYWRDMIQSMLTLTTQRHVLCGRMNSMHCFFFFAIPSIDFFDFKHNSYSQIVWYPVLKRIFCCFGLFDETNNLFYPRHNFYARPFCHTIVDMSG